MGFWIFKKLKKAIYGKVAAAYEVVPYDSATKTIISTPGLPLGTVQTWIMTGNKVAVKMLEWGKIREFSGKYEEDPIKELSAMQYIGEHDNVLASR